MNSLRGFHAFGVNPMPPLRRTPLKHGERRSYELSAKLVKLNLPENIFNGLIYSMLHKPSLKAVFANAESLNPLYRLALTLLKLS